MRRIIFSSLLAAVLIFSSNISAFANDLTDPFRPDDLSSNLVGYWDMSNDLNDSSGNSNNLTDQGSIAFTANDDYFKNDYSADFENGDSDYANIVSGSQTGLEVTSAYTIAFWAKIESTDGSGAFLIDRGGEGNGYGIRESAGEVFDIRVGGSTGVTSSTVSVGKWYHVAFRYDGSTMGVFLDGNLDTLASFSTDAGTTDYTFVIGESTAGGTNWDGKLSDVSIWSAALDPISIKSLSSGVDLDTYAYRPDDVATGPDLWLKMNEVSGNALDSSGNSKTYTDGNTVGVSGGYIEGIGRDFESGNSESFNRAYDSDFDFGTGTWTIATWIKFESTGSDQTIFNVGNAASNDGILWQWDTSNNRFYAMIEGSEYDSGDSTFTPAAGTWYHIGISCDSSQEITYYVDGEAVATDDISGKDIDDAGESGSYIGRNVSAGVNYLDAVLCDFSIWSGYEVTSSEFQNLASGLPIQQQGLVSYYKMDDASGSATDSIGSNDLTETSGTIASTTGVVNDARDFESGDTEYFEIADGSQSGLDLTSDFTLMAWVKRESLPDESRIIDKWVTNTGYFLQLNVTTGAVVLGMGAEANLTGATSTSDSVWYHAAGVYTQATRQVYLDAVLDNSTAGTTNVADTAQNFRIGANASPALYFDGPIDEAIVANRYFRPEEIKTLYIKGLNGKEATSTDVSLTSIGSVDGLAYGSVESRTGLAKGSIGSMNGLS